MGWGEAWITGGAGCRRADGQGCDGMRDGDGMAICEVLDGASVNVNVQVKNEHVSVSVSRVSQRSKAS